MHRGSALVASLGCALVAVTLRAQQPAPVPPQEVFQTGVDLIRLDVSVLDNRRQPVRNLTAGDFTVLENGREQRIVAVTAVDNATTVAPSAWMRHASRDVANNDLGDELGANGQAVAIILDELNIPGVSDVVVATRGLARYIIDGLKPADLAAVVFPLNSGKTQDFTDDRGKLLAAVDRFESEQPEFRWLQPGAPGALEGDVQRYSPTLGRDPCLQLHPAIPTLRTVTARLATVPNRRKTIFFLSIGVPVAFTPGSNRCQGLLYDEMQRTFRDAQRSNVNIYGVDPAGARGYQTYLQDQRVRNGRIEGPRDAFSARQVTESRHDFLETLGEQTGGRAIVDTDSTEAEITHVFEEASSYYLIGYESSNGAPDGKFRRVEVKVNRPGVSVHTQSGYWGPDKNSTVAADRRETASSNSLNLSGMMDPQRLVLRAGVHPIARATGPGKAGEVDVAAVLTVRMPTVLRQTQETVTVVRTVYDQDGKAGPPLRSIEHLTLEPNQLTASRYDVFSRFSLAPGRYQVRFNATSQTTGTSGSVYADVDVPDLTRPAVTMSGIVLAAGAPAVPTDTLNLIANLLPVVPTTAREFVLSDHVTGFVRLFQGGASPVGAVDVTVNVVGADDVEASRATETLAPEAFASTRTAEYRFDLPLAKLKEGPQLLSVTATLAGGRSVRRDLVFRIQ